jgi:hypothetical protein
VRNRLQPWHLAVLVVLLGLAAVVIARWYPELQTYDASRMLSTLPADHSTLVYLDAGALRKDGILELLAGSKAVEEPEYRQFVEQTGFDYRNDLDGLAASLFQDRAYFIARGRFEWKRLSAYAAAQGGQCRGMVCTMPGSRPERNISFYPLQSNLLALAVSPESAAAMHIGPGQQKDASVPNNDPVWMSVPPQIFERPDVFPDGMRSFFGPLAQATKITVAAGPKDKGVELRLEVTCATPEAAKDLTRQLSDTTGLLKKLMDEEHSAPNTGDLGGILTAGSFQQQQSRVIGTWPIERGFIETLASGKFQ